MAVTVILEMQVKPESAGEIAQAMKGAFPDTRAYDGCTSIVANANLDDANNIVLVQNWDGSRFCGLPWPARTVFCVRGPVWKRLQGGLLSRQTGFRYHACWDRSFVLGDDEESDYGRHVFLRSVRVQDR